MKTLHRLGVSLALALATLDAKAALDSETAAPACEAPIALSSAHIGARPVTEGITWDVRYILDMETADDFRGGTLRFSVPLPAGETLRSAPGLLPVLEAGRIVGICVLPEALHARTVEASFLQPTSTAVHESIALGAPVAEGNAVQIVEPRSQGDVRLDWTLDRTIERHVGYLAPRAVGASVREEARRLTDTHRTVTDMPLYVRGTDVAAVGGLRGRFVTPPARTTATALGVGALFAGIVVALVIAARRLRRAADAERADALLASEIDRAAKGVG